MRIEYGTDGVYGVSIWTDFPLTDDAELHRSVTLALEGLKGVEKVITSRYTATVALGYLFPKDETVDDVVLPMIRKLFPNAQLKRFIPTAPAWPVALTGFEGIFSNNDGDSNVA